MHASCRCRSCKHHCKCSTRRDARQQQGARLPCACLPAPTSAVPRAPQPLAGPEPARRWLRERLLPRLLRAPRPSPAAGAASCSFLLAGPRGAGKTEAVFALAAAAGARLIYINGPDVAARGAQTAAHVRALFKVAAGARSMPMVLCVDEAEGAFPGEGCGGGEGGDEGNGRGGGCEEEWAAGARAEAVAQLQELAAAALSAGAAAAAAAAAAQQRDGSGSLASPAAVAAAAAATPRAAARRAWNAGAGAPTPGPLGAVRVEAAAPPCPAPADGPPLPNAAASCAGATGSGGPGGGAPPVMLAPVVVVFVTSTPERLDAAVASTLGARLLLGLPGRDTREEIIAARVRPAHGA